MEVIKELTVKQREERLGQENYNNENCLMKIIEYNNSNDIVVEFQDEYKSKVHTSYRHFRLGNVKNHKIRNGETKENKQGCLMKIIEYNNAVDMIVEFQDKYKARVHTQYSNWLRNNVKNPYYPSVCGVGVTGNKCPTWDNGKHAKEYEVWQNMLLRCYDENVKKKYPTYKEVICCEEWLLYENFYEWLHSQENFNKWKNIKQSALDKDILVKGNKVYSPKTCCLVPYNVNKLFLKNDVSRGSLPIGVHQCSDCNGFVARCMNPLTNNRDYLGYYQTPEEAFQIYKEYKEKLIKQVAQIEYKNDNITKQCFNAMMNYEVEITD